MAAVGVVTLQQASMTLFIFVFGFQFACFQGDLQDFEASVHHILEMKAILEKLDRRLANLERNFDATIVGDSGSGSCDCSQSNSWSKETLGNCDGRFANSLLDQVGRTCAQRHSQGLRKISDRLQNLESWHLVFKREYAEDVQKLLFPRDCDDLRKRGHMMTGVYTIYPVQRASPVLVHCDMELDHGGWTIIQSRENEVKTALDFHRDWNAYKHGFGNPGEDFWLGNKAIHHMTSRAANGCTLRIELRNSKDGRLWVAEYSRFSLGSESERYVLGLQSYSGNASDGLHLHNGRPFCTWDREEEPAARGCAWLERSGWWHHPVATPTSRRICSYPLAGTNLNAPSWRKESGGAPEVHTQALTLQTPSNGSFRYAFVFLGTLYWMDKDGRHFDQVQMKVRPNY